MLQKDSRMQVLQHCCIIFPDCIWLSSTASSSSIYNLYLFSLQTLLSSRVQKRFCCTLVVWCVKYDTQIDTKMLASDWLLLIAANQKPAFWCRSGYHISHTILLTLRVETYTLIKPHVYIHFPSDQPFSCRL